MVAISAATGSPVYYSYIHPRDELVQVMSRMYSKHLTTSSGGNASIRDADGVIWMTPKGNDKGALHRDEIAYLPQRNKEWEGRFPPSSEWPFHTSIFKARPDVKAILHAHSQTLVAFSVANQLPNPMALSQAASLCGENVGMARYAVPGSAELAETIVEQITKYDCVVMANHGVVLVGATLQECYQKFEALEFCARAHMRAKVLGGTPKLLSKGDLEAQAKIAPWSSPHHTKVDGMSMHVSGRTSAVLCPPVTPYECDLRAALVKYIRRAYAQGLIHSTAGAMSAKLSPTSFLITPSGVDRSILTSQDIILVDFAGSLAKAKHGSGGCFYSEKAGLVPSRAWEVHNQIYHAFPGTRAVLHAHPYNVASFCMTSTQFTSDVTPEAYIVLQQVGRMSFRRSLDVDEVVRSFEDNCRDGQARTCNVMLVDNDGVIVKGSSLEKVFDRLEVLEATANVMLECKSIGKLNLMTREQKDEIDEKWFGVKKEVPVKKKQKLSPHYEYGKW